MCEGGCWIRCGPWLLLGGGVIPRSHSPSVGTQKIRGSRATRGNGIDDTPFLLRMKDIKLCVVDESSSLGPDCTTGHLRS